MATDNGTDDAGIEARLRSKAPELWIELWTLVDSLGPSDSVAEWHGGEVVGKTPEGERVLQMPYPVYTDAISRIVELLYELDLVVPFDWMAWRHQHPFPCGEGLAKAPVADAVRLATAYLRGERFGDGTIASGFEDGTFPAILARLRRWREEANK